MLIIEGSDHLGKTTMANRLVQIAADRAEYPIYYSHMTRPNCKFNFFTHYQDMLSVFAVQDRFHIGGLVWHDNVIPSHRLRIIEGWIYALGSYIVIVTADDNDWYKYHLSDRPKKQMFDSETHLKANEVYGQMVAGVYKVPVQFDLHVSVSKGKWPNDAVFEYILDEWSRRLGEINA